MKEDSTRTSTLGNIEHSTPSSGARIQEPEEPLFDPFRKFFGSKIFKAACGLVVVSVVLVVSLAVFRGAASAASLLRGQRALDKAYGLYDRRQFSAAVSAFTAALQEKLDQHDRALAYGDRGWAYQNLERYEDAIRDFNAALEIEQDLVFALLDRGIAFHRLGRFAEALADYNRTISLDPNSVDAYRNRALIFANLGRLQDAIADMNEAVRCAPTEPRWYDRRGEFYLRDGNFDGALASFESAIRVNPEDVDGYWGRGKVYLARNERARAVAEVSEAIRVRSASANLYFARGLIHLDLEEWDKATGDFENTLRLQPEFAMAYSNWGAIELQFGTLKAAFSLASRALSLDPKLPMPHHIRGRVYEAKQEYALAIAEFDQVIAYDPDHVWAVVWRALTEAHAGKYELAQKDLDDAVRKFPGRYESHFMQAWFLATCPNDAFRNGPRAVEEAQLAVQLSHEDASALDTLAAAYAQIGDFSRAREIEEQALTKTLPRAVDRKRIERRLEEFAQERPHRDVQ